MIESLRAKGHDSAGGLRGAKQDLYEGGHRVPLIVKWPGVVAPGTSSRALVSLVDVLATIAASSVVRFPSTPGTTVSASFRCCGNRRARSNGALP